MIGSGSLTPKVEVLCLKIMVHLPSLVPIYRIFHFISLVMVDFIVFYSIPCLYPNIFIIISIIQTQKMRFDLVIFFSQSSIPDFHVHQDKGSPSVGDVDFFDKK